MFAQVTRLQYWKSEHNEATCEDAIADDVVHGLFAVADGAGTTLFSNIWARILVAHFLRVPLLSNDPFEVEWWVRQAQERYKQEAPAQDKLDWNALQKAQSQGSHSTLATVRFSQVSAEYAQAELVVFGDSCVFVHTARTGELACFPLQVDEDFERAPICISSKLSLFNRYFHCALTKQVQLEAGDTILLATDAVSRWIISAGGGRYPHALSAFQELSAQTPETWANFIENCRMRDKIVDDDSTALLVTLHNTQTSSLSLPLGSTLQHSEEIRLLRKKAFEQVRQEQNKELVAIYYGDGCDLELEGVILATEYIEQARHVADAIQETLFVLRQELNKPDSTKIKAIWQKHEQVLATEPCAENLRQTLQRIDIITKPQVVTPEPSQPVRSISSEKMPKLVSQQDTLIDVPRLLYSHEELLREREHLLVLRERLVQAILADDDEAILAAHQAILQLPDQGEKSPLNFQIAQRIELAKKRVEVRYFIQQAIDSRTIEQMANAYNIIQHEHMSYSEEEMQRLELAHSFNRAYLTGNDSEVVKAFEQLQHSPYRSFFAFTVQEEERVTLAWNVISRQTPALTTREANTPTINESWFRKICLLKQVYLLSKFRLQFVQEQIERLALEDLQNDQAIQEGIEEHNQHTSRRRRIDPTTELAGELKKLRNAPSINNYEAFLQGYALSEEDVKAILLIFLRREVFEDYLRKIPMQLQDWLEMHRGTSVPTDQHEWRG